MDEVVCKICKHKAKTHLYNMENDSEAIDCSYCGKYYLMHSLETDIYQEYEESFYKVSSWIRMQNDKFDINPEIDDEKFKKVLHMKDKKIKEKFDLMMKYFLDFKNNTWLNSEVLVKCWIKNINELNLLINKAIEKKLLDIQPGTSFSGEYQYPNLRYITFDGLEYIENLNEINSDSKNIFVAFHFTKKMQSIFDNDIKTVIEDLDFNYVRVSSSTTNTDTHINDDIIGKIKSAKIVIADFTGQRNSVYFEAGFAMGLNIPVIWTCNESDVDSLSFDTRQYPHILWSNSQDFADQLIKRIKTII